MIYLINFIWQLVVFILGDIISYIFIARASFRGYNNYTYYRFASKTEIYKILYDI